jgi:hypothetical protein
MPIEFVLLRNRRSVAKALLHVMAFIMLTPSRRCDCNGLDWPKITTEHSNDEEPAAAGFIFSLF